MHIQFSIQFIVVLVEIPDDKTAGNSHSNEMEMQKCFDFIFVFSSRSRMSLFNCVYVINEFESCAEFTTKRLETPF